MKYLLALVGTLLCTSQLGFAISQYEIEQKPNQYQLAYSSDTERMYIDLSSIHTKQTASNYKTVQARLLSVYQKNNVIADYDTSFTFYSQQPNAPVTMTAWKISKPAFYAENGYPIDTFPQQRLAKDYGQHVAAPNSPSQRIGEYIYNTSKEMEKITYTYDNPYIPPQVFPPVVDQQIQTALFGLMPPTESVISTPMDRVIPAPPSPPTRMQPSLQPGRVGGPGLDSLDNRGRFSPKFNAFQPSKFQQVNHTITLSDKQSAPTPQGFRDNKNRDIRNRDSNSHTNISRDTYASNGMKHDNGNRNSVNHAGGSRNNGGHGNGNHSGNGQGPH